MSALGAAGVDRELARIERVAAAEAINHENGERRILVQSNVRGRDVGSFVSEAQRSIAARVKLPTGYYLAWGGSSRTNSAPCSG